jgi:glycosyltransferase involved in cell wall biosynthesis
MKPTIEVLVCTYNGADFIVEQLQSILTQTTRVDQISIYDDRSSDDTVLRIQEFLKRLSLDDQRLFRVEINATNLGYVRNFSRAIARSTGDILLLCDQDDVWEPDKVADLLALFGKHDVDMVFSDGTLIDHTGRQLGSETILRSYGLTDELIAAFRSRAFELLLKRNYVPGAAAAIRRDAAQNALPVPGEMPHDYWLAIWCSLNKGVIATAKPLYRYRQHQKNVIGGMGPCNPLYVWLGIWRQPHTPRQRELRIWSAVTTRLANTPYGAKLDAAREKLDWLSRVVSPDRSTWLRAREILTSAFNGNYRRYSAGNSWMRDIVSLLK